jgi:phage-related protein
VYLIVLYSDRRGESPVEKFIESLPMKHQRKIAGTLLLLEQQGPELRRPYADQVRGGLRELRVQFGRNQYRLLYFFMLRELIVLVHAFAKKTEAIPEREIATATARMHEYGRRVAAGEVRP